MTFDEGIEAAKAELARALQSPHPELATCVHSDTGSAAIAEAIEKLIARHFLKHMAAMHADSAGESREG